MDGPYAVTDQAEHVAAQMLAYLRHTDALDSSFPQPLDFRTELPDPWAFRVWMSAPDKWRQRRYHQHGTVLLRRTCWVYLRDANGMYQPLRECVSLAHAWGVVERMTGAVCDATCEETAPNGEQWLTFAARTTPYPPDI